MRLLDGLRFGTPIISKVSVCSGRPSQTKPCLSGPCHQYFQFCRLISLAVRRSQVDTTDVAETLRRYLPADKASSQRNHWRRPPHLRLPTADGTSSSRIPRVERMV